MQDHPRDDDRPSLRARLSPPALILGGLVLIASGVAAVVAVSNSLASTSPTARISIRIPYARQQQLAEFSAEDRLHRYMQEQVVILRDPAVSQQALDRHPELATLPMLAGRKDRAGWLASSVKVEVEPGGAVLRVSLESHAPYANQLINAVVEAYMKMARDVESRDMDLLRDNLANILEQTRAENRRLDNEAREIEAKAGGRLGIEAGMVFQARELHDIRGRLREIRLEKVAASTRLARRKGQKDAKPSEIATHEDDAAILSAEEEMLVREEQELMEQAERLVSGARSLRRVQSEIERLDKVQDEYGGRLRRLEYEMRKPDASARIIAEAR